MTLLETATPVHEPDAGSRRGVLARLSWSAAVLTGLAVVGWLPFIGSATKPDEGGYLLVASQWSHGSSLYGDYWVDRPPLLLAIHVVAAALGGTVALRLIGLTGVAVGIAAVTALVRETTAASSSRTPLVLLAAPVAIAAIFMTTPAFGTTEVDGELLSLPFVLVGILAHVRAGVRPTRAGAAGWAFASGVAAVSAAMVKQNAIDVFVFAAAVLVVRWAGDRRRAVRVALVFLAGAATSTAAYLLLADLRGTSPGGLWGAVVVFRLQAAAALQHGAMSAGRAQAVRLLVSCAESCAPLVVAVLALHCRRALVPVRGRGRSVPDLRWPAAAVLAWEAFAVIGGGSFWLHYLLVLVPGMVLLGTAAAQRPFGHGRAIGVVLLVAGASAAFATVSAAHGLAAPSADARVVSYLRANASAGDTALIAFGHPNMLWDTGLRSPYANLWRLPVVIRDPRLDDFTRVLASPRAPTWVVVSGTDLRTSDGGIATDADRVLRTAYHPVVREGRYVIWLRNGNRLTTDQR